MLPKIENRLTIKKVLPQNNFDMGLSVEKLKKETQGREVIIFPAKFNQSRTNGPINAHLTIAQV